LNVAAPSRFGFQALSAALLLSMVPACAGVTVGGLQCEYLTDPLGIDVATPRFTWQLTDADQTRGQKQTGYRVLVADSPALLAQDKGDLWDSGPVASAQSALVPYAGKKLVSNEDCCWKVQVLDRDGKPSAWSAPGRFSMGLLAPTDWTGPWIRHPTAPVTQHLWFRKTFALPEKPASAFIYVASVGYHELYVNGKKADDRVLAPPLTRLDRRILYVTYDITNLLQPGQNCLGIWTGAGWTRFVSFKSTPALRVQLNATMADGHIFSLASDASWRCQASSSMDIGDCKFGDHGAEEIDGRQCDPNWNAVGFDDSRWTAAATAPVSAVLSAEMVQPSRVLETLDAQSISGTGPYRVDLGKNFCGWVSVQMHDEPARNVVTIQVSDEDTAQSFGQKDIYICRGGAETFQNRFNYAGGRYVTLTGLKNKPDLADIKGYVVGTDLPRVGHFTCSSDLFNKIYEADLWTYRADTVEGYTQDCPGRERLGYGEENFATAWGCGLPNYQVGAFYTNDVRSWRDVQDPDGFISNVAPQINRPYGGPMWSSAPLNVGWEFYKYYGDTRILAESYNTYKAWLGFLAAHVSDGILQSYSPKGEFLGDWARPTGPGDTDDGREFGNSPGALLFNNCVYAMNLRTFIQVANVLGKTDDAAAYARTLERLKKNIQVHFFNPAQNNYLDNRQVHLAFPIFAGITPESVEPAVMANFNKEILQTRPYLDMGSSGLPVLLKFLIEDQERDDLVASLLAKTTEPGYGYFLNRGENTWPESWDDNCDSRIHTCFTGIASFFMKGLGGIREDPDCYGYQSFVIKPAIVGNLTFADAETESLYGPIISRWEKQGGAIRMDVTIPVNSSAIVYVPAAHAGQVTEGGVAASAAPGVKFLRMDGPAAVFRVQSGVYRFVSK
jgi:alpha-L-rhamnosidase